MEKTLGHLLEMIKNSVNNKQKKNNVLTLNYRNQDNYLVRKKKLCSELSKFSSQDIKKAIKKQLKNDDPNDWINNLNIGKLLFVIFSLID